MSRRAVRCAIPAVRRRSRASLEIEKKQNHERGIMLWVKREKQEIKKQWNWFRNQLEFAEDEGKLLQKRKR